MSDHYYLPAATAAQLTPDRLHHCKNLGLILDKYPPRTAIDVKSKSDGKGDGKSRWLKQFVQDNHIDTTLVGHVYKRWLCATTAMKAQHFTATTQWRMVVGLGGETVLETDLTLHHLYGIPFIPGSALKGLTRAYVAGEIFESKSIEDAPIEVQRIFGTQKVAGGVIFFDAMPTDGRIAIDLDIMNVHYPKYYGERLAPANNQDPNPVTFLTIANTTFQFALAPRRPQDTEDVTLALGWLQAALQKYGIGGKTSAGYGYFKDVQNLTVAPLNTAAQQHIQTPSEQIENQKQPSYQRPEKLRQFNEGQILVGVVIKPAEELQALVPQATAFLSYESFALKEVLLVITTEEAKSWDVGNTRNCLFLREEACEGCTMLICKPKPKKK